MSLTPENNYRVSRLSFLLRLKGTVIFKIWKQLIFIVVYTVTVVVLHFYVPVLNMDFPPMFIPIIGVVSGLLLGFRTNTAYERYWEGRRLWSTLIHNLRVITRVIWVGVKEPTVKEIIEKKTVLNILAAFAFATKHYLREEYSYDSEDFRDLVKYLPKFTLPISKDSLMEQSSTDAISITVSARQSKSKCVNFKTHDVIPATNIPVELSFYIASYIEYLRGREICEGSLLGTMTSALGNLMETLAGFERILRTPMPLTYSVHLHHVIWLYLLALPYQLASQVGWWTIPAVSLGSFCLLGILEIGWEIENPFGYDDNDLPLDDYCRVIQNEIQVIAGNVLPEVESWLWSPENQPFISSKCLLTATELSEKSVEHLRELLANSNYADNNNTGNGGKSPSPTPQF